MHTSLLPSPSIESSNQISLVISQNYTLKQVLLILLQSLSLGSPLQNNNKDNIEKVVNLKPQEMTCN